MDIKDNNYKRIINEIPIKKDLMSIIESHLIQYNEKEAEANQKRRKWQRFRNVFSIVLLIVVVTASILVVVISNKGFVSPSTVVSQYLNALENSHMEEIKQYVIAGYDIYQDFDDIKNTESFMVNKPIINPEDKSISTVVVIVKTSDVIGVESNSFVKVEFKIVYKLIKIKGKWYITSRNKSAYKYQ